MGDTTRRIAALSIALSMASLAAVFSGTHAIAQEEEVEYEGGRVLQSPFVNDTETAAELSDLLGDDQHILINGSSISDVNNTLPDSITVNIQDDCMTVPNSNHLYCP